MSVQTARSTSARSNGGLVFASVLLFSIAMATAMLLNAHRDEKRMMRTRFRHEVAVRHGRLLQRIAQRRQHLASLVAYFSASTDEVTTEEFLKFSHRLTASSPSVELCWTSVGEAVRRSYPAREKNPPCDVFDLLAPSRILSGPPGLILSQGVADGPDQQGYASVISSLEFISLSDSSETATEYLVVNDTSQNLSLTYQMDGQTTVPEPKFSTAVETKYFELLKFGDVGFYYVALNSKRVAVFSGLRLYLFLATIFLGALAAFFLRDLILRKDLIAREVEARTDELNQFAYRTSHDLRAPLLTVKGLAQALDEDLEDEDTAALRENIQRINKQVSRLDQLVVDILDLARADLEEQDFEPLDFDQLLDEIEAGIQEVYPAHNVQFRRELETSERPMLPRARVSQVMRNLISNAIKYAKHDRSEPPFVKVRVSRSGTNWTLAVVDNGLGISKEHHPKLFRMFERFHPHTSQIGSGLGLSIVKKHIDRLSGTIKVDSDEARGTTIEISIPSVKVKGS